MAKTQTKAAEPAAFEQTNTQSPFPFDVRNYAQRTTGPARDRDEIWRISPCAAQVLEAARAFRIHAAVQWATSTRTLFPCTKSLTNN